MRTLVIFGLAVAAMGAATLAASSPGHAQEYPWCAEYGGRGGGGTNCGFVSYQQCRAALSGNGGFCSRNRFFRGAYQGPRVRPDRRDYNSNYR
jgi:hypothetical protein